MMRYRLVTAVFLLAAAASATAQTFNAVPDLKDRWIEMKKVVISPIDPCPAALDCGLVEKAFYMHFLERRARSSWQPIVVSPEKTRQKMFELGMASLTSSEDRAKLAAAMSAHGLLILKVPHVGSVSQQQALVFPAGTAPEARVGIELYQMASPEVLLVRGESASKGTTMNGQEGWVGTLLRRLLEAFYPR